MIDPRTPQPARRYNYWLGGKDHFAADRVSGDTIAAAFPGVRIGAVENRKFLHRAVRYLAATAGIRQLLDIGVGLPLPPNTHEIAQDIAPDSRVVYVDNDPIVMAHARALLTSHPSGATAYVHADLREPATILHHPDLHNTIDMAQPIGLLLVAVLHFLDDHDATHAVAELLGALAPGSYVVISHGTADFWSPDTAAQIPKLQQDHEARYRPRTREQIIEYVTGLDLVDPDPAASRAAAPTAVSVVQWRPDRDDKQRPQDEDVACYGVVARLAEQPPRPGPVPAGFATAETSSCRSGPQRSHTSLPPQ
ncbi:SAM-dependent methyltransferase [Dactylosporangium sp. CA-139066]|uniref:SAM-dependent methyltransferase n=1 Tax=Dactylosporangium sp. CA-139066 TaxID=3239930 RepID=UPI003D941AEE